MSLIALVTGSSRGIGLGLCRGLLERGHTVFATARNTDAPRIRILGNEFGVCCRPLTLDVTCDASIEAAAQAVRASGLQLDLLIHNAGIFAAGEEGITRVERPAMLKVIDTNAIAPLILTRALLPALKQPGATVAALTSGKWGTVPPARPGGQYSYGISKQALWMALHCLKGDLEPLGIRVLGLGPGFVQTDMTAGSPTQPPLTVEDAVNNLLESIMG